MKVGITGGIGSGKSTICKVFEAYGIPIFYADHEARELYRLPEIISWLKKSISPEVIDENNNVNKKVLSSLIFNDLNKLRLLEDFIHPQVSAKFDEWYQKQNSAPYVLYEAAILFETGRYTSLDKTILVTAPEKTRLQRIVHRDKLDETEIRNRMSRQWDDNRKSALADFVLENIEWPETLASIEKIHQTLLSYVYKSPIPNNGN